MSSTDNRLQADTQPIVTMFKILGAQDGSLVLKSMRFDKEGRPAQYFANPITPQKSALRHESSGPRVLSCGDRLSMLEKKTFSKVR